MSKKERMSATATLTNCYTPLPAESKTAKQSKELPQIRYSGDGTASTPRTNHSLRRLCLSTSILPNSTGSALVELGHTKVLCSVHGPRPITSSSLPSTSSNSGGGGSHNEFTSSGGVLHTEVRFAPKFGIRPATLAHSSPSTIDGNPMGGGSSSQEEEVELSFQLQNALGPSLNLTSLPKCVIDVFVVVLQSDGNVVGAAITAASLALADANVVEMFDLVCACSVAAVPSHDQNKEEMNILADPTEEETMLAMMSSSSDKNKGGGVVTLALMPNWKEVTLWNQVGCMNATSSSDAVNICRDGCATMYQFMRNCLVGQTKKI
mmetsp:Transcript_63336/g.93988  ORF Transcript_63336/g.93988 Transcript_63336/m.93988 type:complete len:321 (-) Transcript_63336:49-1011(-)